MSLADFEQDLATYFDGPRPEAEIADYRAKRGAAKKLRDEVVPVLHHIKFTKAKGEIRFQLNSDIPDCWLRDTPNATPQGLEVTVAQSREQQRLGQLMNETKGMVPGFLGLPDGAPEKLYKERLARGRIMHSSDGALAAVGNGIKSSLQKKNQPRFAGHDLIPNMASRNIMREPGTIPFFQNVLKVKVNRIGRIALPREELARLDGLKLIPGMPVEAFIQTGDRTVMSYLVKPMQDQIAKAFRER